MKIRELRLSKNISQSELGQVIGVSGQTILNWENNIFEPKIEHLIKLADYFNVSIDYLVDRQTNIDKANEIIEELKKISPEDFYKFIYTNISKKIK